MTLSFFNRQPVLDEPSARWIFDLFHWALQQFDAELFFDGTELVAPSNENFPGSAKNVHDKAQLIFDRVKHYAGVTHWPCQLLAPRNFNPGAPQQLRLQGPARRAASASGPAENAAPIGISYDPNQVRTPEVLIANYAHVLAHYMASQASKAPPGGAENWPQATEVLAVFMGFGLMFANTAFTMRSLACGACRGPVADRSNYLSQFDITYALALFCVLKEIPNKAVLPHLKKTLRGYFKKAVKDINKREIELAQITANQLTCDVNGSVGSANRGVDTG